MVSRLALVALTPAFLTSAFLPSATLAQDASEAEASANNVQREPVPEWAKDSEPIAVPDDAQGALFVRRQDTVARLTKTGSRSYQSQLVRMLQPQALQMGNIAISWNPASGPAQIHALRIHRGSRVIDVLESTEFEILRREDQLEQAMLDGQLTASLRVPDLRVGDDLELAYSVPLHDPTLKTDSHGLLYMGDAPPSGRFSLQLSWEAGQKPKLKLTDDLEEVAEREENRITFRFDNPSVISPPRNAPPRYSWMRILEFSDFAEWSEVSERFYPMYHEASLLAEGSPIKQEAAFIAEGHEGKLAQAQAALKLVQQQVRYIYVGLNGGNFTPAKADETWERRYGDCKGKTVLLMALLRELGIDAEPVLVANNLPSDGHAERLPSPGLFDHVLVRARIDGNDYWLDGTLPAVIEARDQPYFRYKSVLPLAAGGKDLEQLPERPFELPQVMSVFDIDASEGFDAPAKLSQVTVARGQAALEQYYGFSSVTSNQLEASLRNQLVGSRVWDTVESVNFRFDRKTQAAILTVTGTGPVDWNDQGNGAYDFYLPGGGFSRPARRVRPEDTYSDVPFWQPLEYSCYATTVRLPKDTEFDKWAFNGVFDTSLYGRLYYRMMELRDDRTLRLVRGSRVEQTEISQERAERDNGRIARFDDSKAVLSYNPVIKSEPWGALRPVPAADEVDWTGANAPCLPPDVLEE